MLPLYSQDANVFPYMRHLKPPDLVLPSSIVSHASVKTAGFYMKPFFGCEFRFCIRRNQSICWKYVVELLLFSYKIVNGVFVRSNIMQKGCSGKLRYFNAIFWYVMCVIGVLKCYLSSIRGIISFRIHSVPYADVLELRVIPFSEIVKSN